MNWKFWEIWTKREPVKPPEPFVCEVCGGSNFQDGPRDSGWISFACTSCWAKYTDSGPMGINRAGDVEKTARHLFRRGEYIPTTW